LDGAARRDGPRVVTADLDGRTVEELFTLVVKSQQVIEDALREASDRVGDIDEAMLALGRKLGVRAQLPVDEHAKPPSRVAQ
jgi:hypothetical protein